MELYITKIILPYLAETKRKLKRPPSHPALLLFDNFKGQCTEKLLKLLDSKIINVVLISPNCTDRLQLLDLSVNKTAKDFLCKCFQKWYALQVCSQLEGKTTKEPVDLRLSVMKPLGKQVDILISKNQALQILYLKHIKLHKLATMDRNPR